MKKDLIDKLIEEQETIENQDIKDAIESFKEEKKAANREMILRRLRQIDSDMNLVVTALRDIRSQEKKCKADVEALNAAKEQFMKDGDWSAYMDVMREIISF